VQVFEAQGETSFALSEGEVYLGLHINELVSQDTPLIHFRLQLDSLSGYLKNVGFGADALKSTPAPFHLSFEIPGPPARSESFGFAGRLFLKVRRLFLNFLSRHAMTL
jgi:hypothetical protein